MKLHPGERNFEYAIIRWHIFVKKWHDCQIKEHFNLLWKMPCVGNAKTMRRPHRCLLLFKI